MDSATTLTSANYQLIDLASKYTKFTNDPEFINGDKTVKITLTKDEIKDMDTNMSNYKFFIDNVKDVAGNEIAVNIVANIQSHAGAIQPGIMPVSDTDPANKVYATGVNEVKVYFDQELSDVMAGAFTVTGNPEYGVELEVVDGKTVAILTFEGLNIDRKNPAQTITVEAGKVVNLFGVSNTNAITPLAIQDKIVPTIKDVDGKLQVTADGSDIKIVFTEELAKAPVVDPALYAHDLVIVKAGKTLVPGADYTTELGVDETNLLVRGLEDGTYKVYTKDSITYIQDTNKNKAKANTTVTTVALDSTAPTVTFAPANSATGVAANANITLTFNEALVKADGTPIADADLAAMLTLKETDNAGAVLNFTATIDAGKKVITINPDADFTAGQVVYVAIAANQVEDAAGNENVAANATFTAVN
jgi:hypothetical protein